MMSASNPGAIVPILSPSPIDCAAVEFAATRAAIGFWPPSRARETKSPCVGAWGAAPGTGAVDEFLVVAAVGAGHGIGAEHDRYVARERAFERVDPDRNPLLHEGK